MTPEKKKKGGAHLEKKPTRETKKKKNRTRDEIIRRRVIVLAVVAAVMLLLAVGLKLWIREPALPTPPVNTGEVVEPGENPGVEVSSDRKKGVYTFLLLGRDTGGGGNTDTMMVATYDTVGQTVNVLNIYRDTMVNAPWDIKRINSVYNFNGGGEEGIQALKEYLQKLIGFSPDFYITVEWNAVGELVDAIGGVEFDVPYEMHYYDPTQNLRIDQAKGLRTLSGDDAMQVIRWRKNNDGSKTSVGDVGRVEIQQNFLKAVMEKCLKTINISTVPKFAQILMNNVTTDIPLGTIVWFGQKALGLDMADLNFHSLPGKLNGSAWSRSYKNYQSYVIPDGPAVVELVNASFNPYLEDIRLSDLEIMSVNKDGSLSVSSGVVRDTKAAQPPVIPSKTPEKPTEEAPGPGEAEPSPSPTESQAPGEASGESQAPVESPEPGPSEMPSLPPEFQPTPTPEGSGTPVGPVTPPPGETATPTPEPTPTATPEPTPTTPQNTEVSPEFLPPAPTPVN